MVKNIILIALIAAFILQSIAMYGMLNVYKQLDVSNARMFVSLLKVTEALEQKIAKETLCK
jgi:hypothetical protein